MLQFLNYSRYLYYQNRLFIRFSLHQSLSVSERVEEESKYTRVEFERRFLVAPGSGWEKSVKSYSKLFADIYLSNTRMRLRVLIDSDSDRRIIKLTKKAPSDSPYFRTISRILLAQNEYDI